MTTNEIREKYLKFFEKLNHKIIPSAPLVLENDSTTLFTSSGMQPLVPYLLGQEHPMGKRLVDSQPSIRVQDIEEVGDNRHTTFFEMLGNWSLGDYFKKEQLPYIFDFLTNKTEGLGLDPNKIYVSVFEGNEFVPKDEEAIGIWENIFESVGIKATEGDRIRTYDARKNWWSRSGTPDQMPSGEIGGPDSEIFYDFGIERKLHENSKYKNEECHPNCDCGRFVEIGNSVFIQYKKKDDGTLQELPQKNVDFGGGLERLAAAVNDDPDVFKIDIFERIISELEIVVNKKYEDDKLSFRVIADHVRASVFLAKNGVIPANKQQGYIMRRLLRRAIVKSRKLKNNIIEPGIFASSIEKIVEFYSIYFEIADLEKIQSVIFEEVDKFTKTLDRGVAEFNKLQTIDGNIAFDLYQTYGFPFEITLELSQEKGFQINTDEFKKAFELHQEKSRTQSAGVFKGGLADQSEITTKLHTTTHLLQASLRKILGEHVQQKGSNITSERLRFDFTHPLKITSDELKKIEDMVNEQITKNLEVKREVMTPDEAKEKGALGFFTGKYGDQVSVYSIGDFSKEICGGPHVTNTRDIGRVTITKEEAVSAGVRRIYATLAN